MQGSDIRKAITRKALLAEFTERGVNTLEQLAAMSVEELQAIHGIGPTTAPRIKASALAYTENKAIWFGACQKSVQTGSYS